MSRSVMVALGLSAAGAAWAALGASAARSAEPSAEAWRPARAPLTTRWAKDVTPDNVHPEYPRPQLVRERWTNLNGLWDYALRAADAGRPDAWDGKILAPFPLESALSGVMRRAPDNHTLWYRRTFAAGDLPLGHRLLLHFGACDWKAAVWVNGREIGEHRGGYDPFSFDITGALHDGDAQELVVAVSDPTDASWQPRGKQVRRPHGIWYTPTTGIWQTVWLEPVPALRVTELRITPDLDAKQVRVAVGVSGVSDPTRAQVRVTVSQDGKTLGSAVGSHADPLVVDIPDARPWSPDAPELLDLRVDAGPGEGVWSDTVTSYCGLRKIALGQDAQGVTRLMLNNQPLFQYGTLDQGFWPDGLYTAPSDEALRHDIEVTKRLGFNMIRKHVKVEPARWYFWCDKLGLLVWQDMPSGDRYIGGNDPDAARSPESAKNFEAEWGEILRDFGNHPCIVTWVPFNEGWGQFDTARIVEFTRRRDPTRLVNSVSGWTDRGVGDTHDVHVYPGPGMAPLSATRASVLGEFGGLGLPLEGHTWQAKDNWGYRSFTRRDDLQQAYLALVARLRPLVGKGLSAAVYTQTTDVEIEVNGLMTYDRAVLKFDAEALARAHRRLYAPPPKVTTLVPTSESAPQTWRHTTDKPADGWFAADFDDRAWASGPGGFGEASTPGAAARTAWKTNDIWLRRSFELAAADIQAEGQPRPDGQPRPLSPPIGELALRMHHDEDAEVYLNGVRVLQVTGYTTDYQEFPLGDAARAALKAGRNALAVHCKQTGGGQYIDVGLVELEEVAARQTKP